jgi:FtsZ-interacting cell division protein ZipA
MDTLQLGILALGAVVVAGIVIYGKWQERAQKRAAERLFLRPEEDVLFHHPARRAAWQEEEEEGCAPAPRRKGASGRREPTLSFETDAETETDAEPFSEIADEELPRVNVPLPADLLLSGVDAIAILELGEAVPARQIMEPQWDNMKRLKKSVLWVGFNETRGIWETLGPGVSERYRRLRIGLQLVDRRGPVSDGDFYAFSDAMQQLAKTLMAVVELPDARTALEQARQLDRFCVEVDIQVAINLLGCGVSFPGTKIRALAEASGMELDTEGSYVRVDENGQVLFTLQNLEADGFTLETLKNQHTNGLVFLFDVPCVPRGQHAYRQMIDVARHFASTLNGMLVDDNRQPLDEAQFGRICQEFVIRPQAALEAAGLPAGGSLALRLFSTP